MRRGFSLLEIVVTSALVVAVSGLFLLASRNAGSKAESRSLAMLVAEQFRLARMEALSRRVPVALVFPTSRGSTGSCSSISWMEGEIAPKLVRHHDYSREFPGARLFIGTWPLKAGLTWTRNPGYAGQKQTMTELNAWLPNDRKTDYCFVFAPDGSVRTNDLPAFDGAYHLAVTATLDTPGGGAAISGATTMTPAGPPNFALTGIGQTFTINLTPTGTVTLETGLAGQDGSLKEIDSGKTTVAAAAPVPPPSSTTNTDPDLIGSLTKPDPDQTLPPDVTNYLTVEEHLSLETYATDPDGDQLWAFWEVTAPPGKGNGAFSYPPVDGQASKTQMTWDPTYALPNGKVGAWRSVVQWRPPPEASPGDRFDLGCKVTDVPAPPVVAQIKKTVQVIPPGKIIFQRTEAGQTHLYRMHVNGFFQQRMFAGGDETRDPSSNIDGSRIVFLKGGNVWLYQPLAKPALVQLTSVGDASQPAINPVGNKVAYRRGGDIYVMNSTAGSLSEHIASTGTLDEHDRMSWNPQGNTLAYSAGGSIHGWGPHPVNLSGGVYRAPYWGGDDVIHYTNLIDGDPYIFRSGPGTHTSGSIELLSPGFNEIQPAVSPDGGSKLIVRKPTGSSAPYNIYILEGATRRQLTHDGENTDPVWVR